MAVVQHLIGEVHVHLLDDLDDMSPRARAFLSRSGWRESAGAGQPPIGLPWIPGPGGRAVAAPFDLIMRREWFSSRFGGLRYAVRRRVWLGDQLVATTRRWDFDLDGWVRQEPGGWSFGWSGERVSSPVRYLVHTDGRFGVALGDRFLRVSPSVYHMVEGHALMDELADWYPLPGSALETWVPGSLDAINALDDLDDLRPVAEASGPHDRWWCSDTVAVRHFAAWTDTRPRRIGIMAWTRHQLT